MLLISFLSSQMYLRISPNLCPAYRCCSLGRRCCSRKVQKQLRWNALHKPPDCSFSCFSFAGLKLFLDPALVPNLFFQALVLPRQIVNGGLVLFICPKCPSNRAKYGPTSVRISSRFFPAFIMPMSDTAFSMARCCLDEIHRLLEHPCGNVHALSQGRSPQLEDGERLFMWA